jgi:hypothetical protein
MQNYKYFGKSNLEAKENIREYHKILDFLVTGQS